MRHATAIAARDGSVRLSTNTLDTRVTFALLAALHSSVPVIMAAVAQAVSFAPEPMASGSSTYNRIDAPEESSQSSSLSSINAQLISHGWSKKPLNLGKLSEKDHSHVVSVLYELLGSSVVRSARHTVAHPLTSVQSEQP